MNRVRMMIALALAAVLCAACVGTAGAGDGPPAVYVMRHLQKATGDDPPLSAEGAANAQRLSGFFRSDPPVAIYVSPTRRAQETAAALAARLGIAPKLYDPRDSAALVEAVKKEGGTVLIVGHSNTVPEIVERLGGLRPAPLTEEDYGDIYKVSGAERSVTRSKL